MAKISIRHIIIVIAFIGFAISVNAQDVQILNDSIRVAKVDSIFSTLNDSTRWNREMEFVRNLDFTTDTDSSMFLPSFSDIKEERIKWKQKDSLIIANLEITNQNWIPDPKKATWLALAIPGGGQIYNKKYWKLPIVYGGFIGCVYALSWNGQMLRDYSNAYIDIMDSDPNTKSYEDLLPPNFDIDSNMNWLKDVIKNRKNKYRRYRDMSIFAFAGVYLVSVIDAYVDAELSHFDVSSDISMNLSPSISIDKGYRNVGFNLAFNF
ncbi:MAG: hypothetical protein J6V02_02545 [Bacteroidaceae bacterium]|nr:hypothetical protein [Bacteroidaceae bacterium]